jgi:hypothetical protein
MATVATDRQLPADRAIIVANGSGHDPRRFAPPGFCHGRLLTARQSRQVHLCALGAIGTTHSPGRGRYAVRVAQAFDNRTEKYCYSRRRQQG